MELLLVIGILAILSVISFGSFMTTIARGRDAQRKSDIATLKKAIEQFANDLATYPEADATGKIKGCSTSFDGVVTYSTCSSNFSYYVNGEKVTVLNKYPTDPSSDRAYYYQTTTDGYELYAALENTNDKDVWVGSTPLGLTCGTVSCNYKVTNAGVQTQ